MLVYGILGCFLSALTTSKFFPGDQCELSACTRECQNHGICYVNASGVLSCKCPLGYDGKHCERIVKNICHRESPCGLHGTCLLTTSLEDYECNCHKGWTGPDCSQRDLCPLDYCSNGGKCRRDRSEFVCDCPHNYHGNQCELDVNECDQDLCVHGKCVNTVGSYRCECYDNFIGADCQISRNEEDCTVFGPKSCRNGGVCNTENNNYTCICPHTYDGHFCERDVDECATTNLCQNGGTCVNSEGGFSCLCTAAFEGMFSYLFKTNLQLLLSNKQFYSCALHFIYKLTNLMLGELCTVNKDDCVYNKCAAGSTCVDEIGKYRCECPTGIIDTFNSSGILDLKITKVLKSPIKT
uniref:Neurogenic locus Notch protein n=1 Tax=Heterorhabditis bacteriophora TaxID=37862 RepID=A0A1I7X428_HETBA